MNLSSYKHLYISFANVHQFLFVGEFFLDCSCRLLFSIIYISSHTDCDFDMDCEGTERAYNVFAVLKGLLLFSIPPIKDNIESNTTKLISSNWESLNWDAARLKVLMFKTNFINDQSSQ